jgi:hypothetical protein
MLTDGDQKAICELKQWSPASRKRFREAIKKEMVDMIKKPEIRPSTIKAKIYTSRKTPFRRYKTNLSLDECAEPVFLFADFCVNLRAVSLVF